MSESYIETRVVKYGEARGLYGLKLNVVARRGWPDRLFLGEGAKLCFIEFKAVGEKPRKLQLYIHKILKRLGFDVFVVDNVKEGQEILKSYFSLED